MVLLGFPHFSATESHNKTNATRRTAWKKFALAERQRARNFLIFRCGCKQETLGCKRLKIKRRISFATRLISLRPSHANFDFLFSNFAVRDFILFALDFNTQPEMFFNRKLKFVLMRSAFCRGVGRDIARNSLNPTSGFILDVPGMNSRQDRQLTMRVRQRSF